MLIREKISIVVGILLTISCIALILVRASGCSEVFVPKPRYWLEDVVRVQVCPPVDLDLMEEAAEVVPMCTFSFSVEDLCATTRVPSGKARASEVGPLDGKPRVEHRVATEGTWVSPEGVEMGIGMMLSAEVKFPKGKITKQMRAQELGHLCGYEHAIELGGRVYANNHIMSHNTRTIGWSTDGMDLSAAGVNVAPIPEK
jgi:hypothetical protein